MINLHHGHPWKTKQKTLISTEYRKTTWIREIPHSKKMMREASTHGTIVLPKHEHWINTREKENELYQTNMSIVKITLT